MKPERKQFGWTGANELFTFCDQESVRVGGGNGKTGLSIDADLFKGYSETCATFDNCPLAGERDYEIKNLECWAFPS